MFVKPYVWLFGSLYIEEILLQQNKNVVLIFNEKHLGKIKRKQDILNF